jgi:hypothetical protein
VAQVDPIRFPRGNYSKRATVALPGSIHRSPPAMTWATLADFLGCLPATSRENLLGRDTDIPAVVACAKKSRVGRRGSTS